MAANQSIYEKPSETSPAAASCWSVYHTFKSVYLEEREILFVFIYLPGKLVTPNRTDQANSSVNKSGWDVGHQQLDNSDNTALKNSGSTTNSSSMFIWVGDNSLDLEDLYCAFLNKTGTVSSTALIEGNEDTGEDLVSQLVKKFKIPIYLSLSLPVVDDEMMLHIQKTLIQQLELRDTWVNENV